MTSVTPTKRNVRLVAALAGAAAAWALLFTLNEFGWTFLFSRVFGLNLELRVPNAIHFFLYDTVKILLLLVGMIFVIGLLRTTLRPEKVRQFLENKPILISLALAALFGAVTPFCSCSSIPLFIGFVAAGIPISVTLTFLIASPLVNEVAVILLADTFGVGNMLAYVAASLTAAILIGFAFSRLPLEHLVESFVFDTPVTALPADGHRPGLSERVEVATAETREIVGRVWKWVLVGVGIGALIHGWVPTEFFVTYAGPDNPFAVVVATVIGAPMYANAVGVIPIAEAMWSKGMALGTVMSFMMATVALSLPEFILLKQVLKPKLLALFFGSVMLAIMIIGLLFNLFAV